VYSSGGSYCGQSELAECDAATTQVSGTETTIFFVFAAFREGNAPSLTAVSFGVQYDADRVAILEAGGCGDIEQPSPGWPDPGTGTHVVWGAPQVSDLTEVEWFAAYAVDPSPASIQLVDHPSLGARFYSPSQEDAVACLGALGFGEPGRACCPAEPRGACCLGGACEFLTAEECADLDGEFEGLGTPCLPSPCETAEVWPPIAGTPDSWLGEPWPNPTSGTIRLRLAPPASGKVRVELIDPGGRLVSVLFDGWLDPEPTEIHWVRRAEEAMASGVYFLRARWGEEMETSRVVVIRD
jgi:hypothetical protein